MGYYSRGPTPNTTWPYKYSIKSTVYTVVALLFIILILVRKIIEVRLFTPSRYFRHSVMGRPWRIIPTLCLAASVVLVRGQGNAANAQDEQKPIASPEHTASGNPLTSEYKEFVLERLDEWKVPGVAVAVIDGDEVYAEVNITVE